MNFLTYFCQRSGLGTNLPTPPFLLGFTVITDPPRAGEVRPGCGPQSAWRGVAQSELISFLSRAV
jgi:hypothetical protein